MKKRHHKIRKGMRAYEKARKKPLGEGSRFAAIEAKAKAGGARNPGAVAYMAGVKVHGKKAMTRYSKMGRRAS